MLSIYRLGFIIAACAVAVITGLSVAFLATPRISPSSPTGAPAASVPTDPATAPAVAQLQVPTAPPTSAAVQLQAPTVPPANADAPPASTPSLPAAIPVRSPDQILQQVRATVASMRSGQIDAVIDYGDGNRSVAKVTFDVGADARPTAFAIATTYEGPSGHQTAQRITIGDRTWQRQAAAAWQAQPAEESVGGELQAFLPQFDTVKNLAASEQAELLALHWSGANGDDLTLLIDTDTNLPRELRQQARETGTLLTITYHSWDTPVEINPPV